jgi:hypothetical protein
MSVHTPKKRNQAIKWLGPKEKVRQVPRFEAIHVGYVVTDIRIGTRVLRRRSPMSLPRVRFLERPLDY